MNYEYLFKQIDSEREEKGYNPTSLCRKAGLSQMSWVNLKNPRRGINTDTISKFAKVLGMDEVILKVK